MMPLTIRRRDRLFGIISKGESDMWMRCAKGALLACVIALFWAASHPTQVFAADNDCRVDGYAEAIDYATNTVHFDFSQDLPAAWAADVVDCTSRVGQAWMLIIDHDICVDAGLGAGVGYAEDRWDWDFVDGGGGLWAGSVGPQTYDCGDV
jgi:hypothetical protein